MTDSEQITIGDVMTKSVISADSAITVSEAAKMMEDSKVGCLVAMENNQPVGIVTDRDFAVKITAHAYPISTPIKQIMSSPIISVSPTESIQNASDSMYVNKVRKLPVIDHHDVIGIITATDIVNLLAVCVEDDLKKIYFDSITKIYSNYSPYN